MGKNRVTKSRKMRVDNLERKIKRPEATNDIIKALEKKLKRLQTARRNDPIPPHMMSPLDFQIMSTIERLRGAMKLEAQSRSKQT